jgi:hypothetical protein
MEGETQQCPQCGAVLPADIEHCPECGTQLILRLEGDAAGPPPFIEHSEAAREAYIAEQAALERTKESPLPGEEVDERFVNSYSCATGCWLYLCNRVFWAIVVIGFLFGSCSDIWDSQIEWAAEKGDNVLADSLTVVGLLIGLTWLGFLLWLGRIIRRKRWQRLKYKSFQQFVAEERTWHIIGLICWILAPIAWILVALLEPA